MDDSLSFRTLEAREWPEAMTLAARSFQGEPFIAEMFGHQPLQRFAKAHRFYRATQRHESDVQLGAFVDGVLVGLTSSSPAGRCHICEYVDPLRPPADPAARIDWMFEVNTQAAHSDQGTHAWLGRLVVDPALQGAGIGRALVARSLEGLRAETGTVGVVLECQSHREALYLACGFERVRTFPDPAGPDCLLMRAEVEARHDRSAPM